MPDQGEWGTPERPKRGKALNSVTQGECLGMQPGRVAPDTSDELSAEDGFETFRDFFPRITRCGAAAIEAVFRLRCAGRDGVMREGVGGNGRKEFPTIRGERPRLHRTRFEKKVGRVVPDERHAV